MSNGPLVGCKVTDERGAEYTVTQHHVEADEVLLERGESTHAMTVEDLYSGGYEVFENE